MLPAAVLQKASPLRGLLLSWHITRLLLPQAISGGLPGLCAFDVRRLLSQAAAGLPAADALLPKMRMPRG